jgi:uncharacterized protein (TIGR03790 family)
MYWHCLGSEDRLRGCFLRLFALLPSIFATGVLFAENPDPSRVVVLANSSDRDSINLATHYAQARNVPQKNIVLLRMPRTEEVGWLEFSRQILNPLRENLIARELIDGRFGNKEDVFGRRLFVPLSSSIEYLVVCRGIPLRLKNEAFKFSAEQLNKVPVIYRTTIGSVDAELALLSTGNHSPLGWVPNPLFKRKQLDSLSLESVVKVSRLDGPTQEASMRLVDLAIAGEQAVYGRAYIDSGGPHKLGNEWMEAVATRLKINGFEVDMDNTPNLFHAGQRFDAPLFYFGWHSFHAQGPFARKDIRFPQGAMIFHIHSFSAQSLRTDSRYWAGPLIQRGVAATIGNVSEPYLHLTHHLPLLLEGLLEGKCLADSAYYSLPSLGWQSILLGDPLYRPAFANSISPNMKIGQGFDPFHAEQYGIIRKVQVMHQNGETPQAYRLGQSYLHQKYGLPLALSLIRLETDLGFSDTATSLLAPVVAYRPKGFQEAVPLLQAAKLLNHAGRSRDSQRIHKNVATLRNLPQELSEQIQ